MARCNPAGVRRTLWHKLRAERELKECHVRANSAERCSLDLRHTSAVMEVANCNRMQVKATPRPRATSVYNSRTYVAQRNPS